MENSSVTAGSVNTETAQVMTVKDWIITTILVAIPIVGFIMLFIWAFGDGANPNKANWAKASLLLMVIFIGFFAIIGLITGGFAAFSSM